MSNVQKNKKQDSTFEIQFYERILKERPHFIECLRVLAELYTRVGRYNDGLKLDKELIQLTPHSATVYYNLACSHSLLNNISDSLDALHRAVDLGFCDIEYMQKDPDLINVRQDERFRRIVNKTRDRQSF